MSGLIEPNGINRYDFIGKILLAQRYEENFRNLLKYRDLVEWVTFWGVSDDQPWKNNGHTGLSVAFRSPAQTKKLPLFHCCLKNSVK
jgi:hypothetical protein